MSANLMFEFQHWTHDELAERVVQLSLEGTCDSFEWHCLDQEVQRRLADDYIDRTTPAGQVGRFRPVLVNNVE